MTSDAVIQSAEAPAASDVCDVSNFSEVVLPTDVPLSLDSVCEEIARRRDTFTQLKHVPRDVIALFKRAHLYRAATPKCFGGTPMPPAQFLRMIERIAEVDGSAAWVASFGSANVYLAALPLASQAILYASGPDQAFAGGLFPVQPASVEAGGYRVSGRWRFASGCKGADWLGVGIGGAPGTKPRMAILPPSQVEIVENWDVVGMQGTGSHDLRVDNVFVPEEWTFTRGGQTQVDEPLYRYPTIAYAAQVLAVVNLGLARAALDTVNQMSGGRKTTTGAPQLADRAYFRIALSKAEARLRGVQAFFYDTTETVWDAIMRGDQPTPDQVSALRLTAAEAAFAGADVVQAAYRLGGIASIYSAHRLQQLMRDAMVVTQHAFLGEGIYDGAGSVYVGATPFPGYI
ncbi:acyl-CoA dehydrogenase family protein [Robbsia sp. KACC 23696]|uniref:acyl-CoA dehydrogenase family protein n=1 Tax=Robbsia sp. KACC 23696 TaxID=3149231 RepID=UPI00325ABF47